jgi:mono/diheme cytochrome c family protein
MPRWITSVIVILVCLSFIPLAMIYVTRAQRNADTRMSIIPDMDDQQKFKAQQLNLMFADSRAMRPQVAGTVARGELDADTAFYHGIEGDQWIEDFPPFNPERGAPMVIDEEFILRGQERFNIYCSMCHGYNGDGQGMVARRVEELSLNGDGLHSWTPPLSYHTEQVRNRPNGHIYNTITNGIRNMPPYGPQIEPEDRWAIVAYIRALQRTRQGSAEDIPADQRELLDTAAPPPAVAAENEESASPATAEEPDAAGEQ